MFQDATNPTMKDCSFTIVNGDNYNFSNKSVLEILYENAAPGGFHISEERYDPPKCHDDTRITVRQDLLDQVKIAVVSCIIWLYGAAGAGKSAIAQSFAETCQLQGLLIGSFFFFRAAPSRNNAKRLAASLAYQLARSIPATLQHIARCITSHPAIFVSSFEDQMTELFVQPLCRACEEDTTLKAGPRLVIVDGLDECGTPDVQRNILKVLEKALQFVPIPIVVLVVSRPETHISSFFESLDRRASIPTFRFGLNDIYDVDGDIRLYLNDKFKEIKRDHPFRKYLPDIWPCFEDVESIITKSSGQFIYAATIIRYIGHHKCNPHERLQTALDAYKHFTSAVRDSPFKELDALYHQLFSGIVGSEEAATLLAILYLAFDIGEDEAQYPRTIAFRLGLGSSDVEIKISDLASLMRYEGEETPIRLYHASLRDFLLNDKRSRELYIDQPAVHTVLLKAYLRQVIVSVPAFYAVIVCPHHMSHATLDQELSELAVDVESKMPEFIKALHFEEKVSTWRDGGGLMQVVNPTPFSDFVTTVHRFARHTKDITFWGQCLRAIHGVSCTHLPVYLTDENTHDLPALSSTKQGNPFNPYSASSLGISSSAWRTCSDDKAAQEILQNSLLDFHLSAEAFVTSEQCARVAMKCLDIVKNTRLLREVPVRYSGDLSDDEHTYLCAVESLSRLLHRASECQQLLDSLIQFKGRYHWLTHYPGAIEKAQDAINLYLKKNAPSPKSPTSLSLGQRVLEWSRGLSGTVKPM